MGSVVFEGRRQPSRLRNEAGKPMAVTKRILGNFVREGVRCIVLERCRQPIYPDALPRTGGVPLSAKLKPSLWLFAILLLLGGSLVWWRRPPPPERDSVSAEPAGPGVPHDSRPAAPHPKLPDGALELAEDLRALRGLLVGGLPPAEAARRLEEIARRLRVLPPDLAAAVLILMLDEGLNAATGLPFKVGLGGNLETASTLRVWMLDLLGQVDPAEGARYARRIYERHDSADEWAIALRNDWRVSAPAGQIAEVRQRALELINDARWAETPSAGFLEAFDLTVATMAWEAVSRLEQMLAPAQGAELRRASWVALDRLALETPADFLPILAQRPDWLKTQPLVRAGLFARADLASERERIAVESYLTRPNLTAEEGAKFFALAPNVNATVSYNLATTARVPTLHDAARLDRAALQALQSWQTRAEFQRWREVMDSAEVRLRESIAAAIRGGYLKP